MVPKGGMIIEVVSNMGGAKMGGGGFLLILIYQ